MSTQSRKTVKLNLIGQIEARNWVDQVDLKFLHDRVTTPKLVNGVLEVEVIQGVKCRSNMVLTDNFMRRKFTKVRKANPFSFFRISVMNYKSVENFGNAFLQNEIENISSDLINNN